MAGLQGTRATFPGSLIELSWTVRRCVSCRCAMGRCDSLMLPNDGTRGHLRPATQAKGAAPGGSGGAS